MRKCCLHACISGFLHGKECVCLYTYHSNVYIWFCFEFCMCRLVSNHVYVCVYVSAGWVGAGSVMDGKHTPIPQPPWPCSLTPYSYIFFSTPLTAASTPITQTHTHTHAPTAPVAPTRLLGEEQGDPGCMGGGGNQGRTCPGSAFWSSSRQGDRSAVTPALEETAPSSGGGDGPPSFALR